MDARTATTMDHREQPLAGRRVLVTGASSGIGAATASAVVAAGGSVALLARRASVLEGLAHELATLERPAGVDVRVVAPSTGDAVPSTGDVVPSTGDAGRSSGDAGPSSGDAGPSSGDAARSSGDAARATGGDSSQRIAVVPADVVDAEACRVAVDRAADALGGLDGLVNAAGVLRPGSTLDGDPADWQLTFDGNVRGVLHASSAAAGHLRTAAQRERPVDVVNVSSMSGRRLGTTEMAVYAASKAAVHMFSEGMRREFAADGIRLAVVSPGIVATGIFDTDDGNPRDDTAAMLARKAEEAGLDPEDVAAAIVGLLAAPAHVVHQEVALRHLGQ